MSTFVCSFCVEPVGGVGEGEVEAGGRGVICGECSPVHSVIVFLVCYRPVRIMDTSSIWPLTAG